MIGKYYICLVIIVVLSLTGCQPKEKTESIDTGVADPEIPVEERAEKAMHDEIMAIHDEVMPKMDVIMRIKGQLNERVDSLRDLPTVPAETIEKLESHIAALQKADESMMGWMRQWNPPADSVSHDLKMDFFKAQQVAVEEVKSLMLNSIEEAQTVLESME